ncbi:MAG: hypothetical protein CMJ51_01490 [Planctomycetaceae bacterium]|nr:hypothetical protein [Planctomycetaceae bacterium]
MQVLLLILVASVLLPVDGSGGGDPWAAAIPVLGGSVLLVLAASIRSVLLQRELSGPDGPRRIERAARTQRLVQWAAVLIVVGGVIGLGFRDSVRSLVGDPPLLDEALTMAPALLSIIAAWWIFQPFERRASESTLLRRIDDGQPVHPLPGRGAWVAMQVRSQMLVVLVPIALLAFTGESIRMLVSEVDSIPGWAETLLPIVAIVPVVALAPWLVVRLVGATPLPPGEVREILEGMCRRAGVRVRDLLLWPTGGLVINAGVTGIVGSLRWVMLTDGLLDLLHRRQVMAVMAHELAHARRHHLIWMALAVLALAIGMGFLIDPLVVALYQWRIDSGGSMASMQRDLELLDLAAAGLVLIGVLVGFGWVSRRFERQADAFAAVRMSVDDQDEALPVVSSSGAVSMASALMTVSLANGVPMERFSWRHGSIDSRRRHLESLIGRPIESLPIDRTVRVLNVTSLLVVCLAAGWWGIDLATDGAGGIGFGEVVAMESGS